MGNYLIDESLKGIDLKEYKRQDKDILLFFLWYCENGNIVEKKSTQTDCEHTFFLGNFLFRTFLLGLLKQNELDIENIYF